MGSKEAPEYDENMIRMGFKEGNTIRWVLSGTEGKHEIVENGIGRPEFKTELSYLLAE